MNIQLKQSEIEVALRQYLERQGISLRNKSFAVDFTSGRGNNGLSAEAIIEDISIPGDNVLASVNATGPSADVAAMVKPALLGETKAAPAVESKGNAEVATASVATKETEVAKAAPVAEAQVEAGAAETVVETPAPAEAKTVASLFGTP
jgi:hypothetical protein